MDLFNNLRRGRLSERRHDAWTLSSAQTAVVGGCARQERCPELRWA